jgi:hypothetical protein
MSSTVRILKMRATPSRPGLPYSLHQSGNHQAWIAGGDVDRSPSKDVIRRVRKAVGDGDLSASGATLVAGVENWKMKYLQEPPIVSIVHGLPGRAMSLEQLKQMGFARRARADKGMDCEKLSPIPRKKPTRAVLLERRRIPAAPVRIEAWQTTRGKFSAQRGWSVEEIAAELPNVNAKACERIANRDPGCPKKTARNGVAAALRSNRETSRA